MNYKLLLIIILTNLFANNITSEFKEHLAITFVDMHIIYTEYCLNQKNYSKAIWKNF